MLLKNYWYVAAEEQELAKEPLARTILNENIVLFRTHDGNIAALQDLCPHRLVPLSMGKVTELGLKCGYHSLTFAPSGNCVLAPGCDRIPHLARVKSYPLLQKYGWIWIWMGEPAAASPDKLPTLIAPYFDGKWAHARGYTYMRGNYELVTDNLLDATHADTVHPGTLGSENVKDYAVESRVEGATVYVNYSTYNTPATGLFQFLLGTQANVDQWVRVHWQAPSSLVLNVGSCPTGQDHATGKYVINIDLLTPETEHSSHYFWTTSRNFNIEDDAMTQQIKHMTAAAFDQDKALIEAQQRIIGDSDLRGRRLAFTSNDVGLTRSREIVANLYKTEKNLL